MYESFAKAILRAPEVAIDTETTGLDPFHDTLKGVSMAWEAKGEVCSHYWSFDTSEMSVDQAGARWQAFNREILEPLGRRRAVILIFWNSSFDLKVLRMRGWQPRGRITDGMIAAYLLDENKPHGLKETATAMLGVKGALSFAAAQKQENARHKALLRKIAVLARAVWRGYVAHQKGTIRINQLPKAIRYIVQEIPAGFSQADVTKLVDDRVGIKWLEKEKQERQDRFHEYARKDAHWTYQLHKLLLPKVHDEGFAPIYWNQYLPVRWFATEMEWVGIRVNFAHLGKIRGLLAAKLKKVKEVLVGKLGEDFNPGSASQLKQYLWVKHRVKPPPWVKKEDYDKQGFCSTGEDILDWVASHRKVPVLKDILLYRKLTKTLNTYVDPLIADALADPNQRVHTSFAVTKKTGRWGSSDPNLQNIPQWSTLKEFIPDCPSIREAFVPELGYILLIADYSQIDARVMAHCTRDPLFYNGYRSWVCAVCGRKGETNKPYHACPKCGEPDKDGGGKFVLGADIHMDTAERTGLVKKYGPKDGRKHAKKVNFGAIYLEGYKTLAQQIGMPEAEAKVMLNTWHQEHFGIKVYSRRLEQQIYQHGFFRMLNGQKRRFDRELRIVEALRAAGKEEDARKRAYGITRTGMNNTGQGGAATIIDTAILILSRPAAQAQMKKWGMRALLQVHDELLFEIKRGEHVEEARIWLRDVMESAGRLDVPVLVNVAIGETWEDKE